MEINDLEKSYAIHIEKKDEKYLFYNYFGRLLGEAKSLSEIKKYMQQYYKEAKND